MAGRGTDILLGNPPRPREGGGAGGCTSSAQPATRPGGSTTNCAAAPAGRAIRALRASSSAWMTICWCASGSRRTRTSTACSAPRKPESGDAGDALEIRIRGGASSPRGVWLAPRGPAVERTATLDGCLAILDDLWADYLANVAELRGGIHWVSWGGRDPLHSFLTGAEEIYADFLERLDEDIAEALANPNRGAARAERDVDLSHHRPALRHSRRAHRESGAPEVFK